MIITVQKNVPHKLMNIHNIHHQLNMSLIMVITIIISTKTRIYITDIVVPIDFPTIQEAIDAANVDNIIKVLSNTYTEQITISRDLTLTGLGAKYTRIYVQMY